MPAQSTAQPKIAISPEDKQEVQYVIGQYRYGIVPLQPHPENLSLRNAIQ